MCNKPVKWGFKLWVISDPTEFTLDFNMYTGKSENHSQHGLAFGVVQELLITLYIFQRYFLFFDNFYSSTKFLADLYNQEVYATRTFRIDRRTQVYKSDLQVYPYFWQTCGPIAR